MEQNICRYCYKQINNKDQLVIASQWLCVKPFHYLCYEEVERETNVFWRAWTVVNGPAGNVRFLILTSFFTVLTLTNSFGFFGDLMAVILSYPILARLFSFLWIERKFPDKR